MMEGFCAEFDEFYQVHRDCIMNRQTYTIKIFVFNLQQSLAVNAIPAKVHVKFSPSYNFKIGPEPPFIENSTCPFYD